MVITDDDAAGERVVDGGGGVAAHPLTSLDDHEVIEASPARAHRAAQASGTKLQTRTTPRVAIRVDKTRRIDDHAPHASLELLDLSRGPEILDVLACRGILHGVSTSPRACCKRTRSRRSHACTSRSTESSVDIWAKETLSRD